jgi:hypothetical protein
LGAEALTDVVIASLHGVSPIETITSVFVWFPPSCWSLTCGFCLAGPTPPLLEVVVCFTCFVCLLFLDDVSTPFSFAKRSANGSAASDCCCEEAVCVPEIFELQQRAVDTNVPVHHARPHPVIRRCVDTKREAACILTCKLETVSSHR